MTSTMENGEAVKVAVRCTDCKRIIGYKMCKGTGIIEVKCPKCGKIACVDLSMRRAKYPIFYRRAAVPLDIPMI